MTAAEGLDFASSLSCLVNPALADLRTRLALVPGLASAERTVIADACAAALGEAAHRKLSRVLILELNAARVTGRLRAADSAGRWDEFLSLSASPQFWGSLGTRYPTMLGMLRTVLAGRCEAACQMAARLAADRDAIAGLPGTDPGELTGVRFGAGDSHRGGQTVAALEFAAGAVMYKPRSVRVDAVLGELLAEVLGSTAAGAGIRVPDVLSREGYGWAEFVTHRYCADDAELACFYRGIGRWLAVLRLIGGTDLHVENMIACGPVPVVVDCEVLFTPMPPASASGLGQAVDHAAELVNETVLRTGMLPTRGVGLGWRGVDISAAGSLPGQQPVSDIPVIVDAGLDTARIGFASDSVTVYANHPSPEPALARYWDQVIAGFAELTATLRTMDRQCRLEPLLRRFADCPVRMVLRATEVYAEVGRMLWHPVSLHDPGPAQERARGLLTRMAESLPGAPDDPQVIAAEVAELLNGDVPFFTTTPARGQLTGPAGTTWLPERDLITDALTRWRGADLDLDRGIIQATLVSAYLNEGWMPADDGPMPGGESRLAGLDGRRRALAAMVLGQIRDAAISAADGTVTWIAPVLNATGWAVQPLSPDLYSGLPGVAVLLAAYERESVSGRATRVDGLDELLAAALRTMRAAEDLRERAGRSGDIRPRPPGGFVGLGSQIWAWLTLDRWGAAGTDGISRARKLASQIPAAAAVASCELLAGMAGAIVPLLQLAAVTGEDRWITEATVIGSRLTAAGQPDGNALYWPSPRWPAGLGGCAHGATGIGWALARLALATGDTRSAVAAQAAFRFEERLYDAARGSWLDLRQPGQTAVAWCHGAVGIGLLTADLAARGSPVRPDVVSRAAQAAERLGFGWNHTLCHGDLGCWELLSAAFTDEPGQDRQQRLELDARVIGSLEHNGPVTGLARDAFAPGLLPGLGGIGYQLLRMHPHSDLPSILTLSDPVRSAP